MLFTSPISSFSVVADQCTLLKTDVVLLGGGISEHVSVCSLKTVHLSTRDVPESEYIVRETTNNGNRYYFYLKLLVIIREGKKT